MPEQPPTRTQVSTLLDQYASLVGRPRSQTHRYAIGIAITEALLADRRVAPATAAKATAPPAAWTRTRTRRAWDGRCATCGQGSQPGELVAWDTESGRPSTWAHVDCADPYGDGPRPKRKGRSGASLF